MMSDTVSTIPVWIAGLASAVSELDTQQLQSLADLCLTDRPSMSPEQLQRCLRLPTTNAVHLARNLRLIVDLPEVTTYDVWIALCAILYSRASAGREAEHVEVVCTAPSRFGIPVRATYATLLQMVQEATREVLVVGYLFTEGSRAFVESLASVSRDKRVHVTLVGNRMQQHLPALKRMWFADSPAPAIFSWDPDSHNSMAALHAKLLVCDSRTALITSANFSYQGLHGNVEIGVKVESPAVNKLAEFIRSMISTGEVRRMCW